MGEFQGTDIMATMIRVAVLSFALGWLAGCGAEPDVLVAYFADELVEAPARQVDVVVMEALSCPRILEIPHDHLEQDGRVRIRKTLQYPIDPDAAPFDDVPRGRPLSVDVQALDTAGHQIARGCVETTFEPGRVNRVEILLEPLPTCEDRYHSLHVGLIVDRSLAARNADIALEHRLLPLLGDFIRDLTVPGGVTWTLLDHGPEPPVIRLSTSLDAPTVASTLELQTPSFGGQATHYAALEEIAISLRSAAICPRRPVVLWIGADEDHSGTVALELARSAILATPSELQDDLFVFAIALADPGLSVMQDLLATLERKQLEGASTVSRLQDALLRAKFLFQGLVE